MSSPPDVAEVAYRDQLAAASSTAERRMTQLASRVRNVTGAPAWFRARLDRHNRYAHDHGSRVCEHLHARVHATVGVTGTFRLTEVVHVASWLPGVVACDRCGLDALLRVGDMVTVYLPDDFDVTCDRCGAALFDDGDGDGDQSMATGCIQVGPLIMYFVMCPGCLDEAEQVEGETR